MTDDMRAVSFYSEGLCHASVCAPKDLPTTEIVKWANETRPTGVTPWEVSDEAFSTGQPNGCPCNMNPEERRHWLLVC